MGFCQKKLGMLCGMICDGALVWGFVWNGLAYSRDINCNRVALCKESS